MFVTPLIVNNRHLPQIEGKYTETIPSQFAAVRTNAMIFYR